MATTIINSSSANMQALQSGFQAIQQYATQLKDSQLDKEKAAKQLEMMELEMGSMRLRQDQQLMNLQHTKEIAGLELEGAKLDLDLKRENQPMIKALQAVELDKAKTELTMKQQEYARLPELWKQQDQLMELNMRGQKVDLKKAKLANNAMQMELEQQQKQYDDAQALGPLLAEQMGLKGEAAKHVGTQVGREAAMGIFNMKRDAEKSKMETAMMELEYARMQDPLRDPMKAMEFMVGTSEIARNSPELVRKMAATVQDPKLKGILEVMANSDQATKDPNVLALEKLKSEDPADRDAAQKWLSMKEFGKFPDQPLMTQGPDGEMVVATDELGSPLSISSSSAMLPVISQLFGPAKKTNQRVVSTANPGAVPADAEDQAAVNNSSLNYTQTTIGTRLKRKSGESGRIGQAATLYGGGGPGGGHGAVAQKTGVEVTLNGKKQNVEWSYLNNITGANRQLALSRAKRLDFNLVKNSDSHASPNQVALYEGLATEMLAAPNPEDAMSAFVQQFGGFEALSDSQAKKVNTLLNKLKDLSKKKKK